MGDTSHRRRKRPTSVSSTDRISRAIAVMALLVCAGQLWFQLSDWQATRTIRVLAELAPVMQDANVEVIVDRDLGCVVLGFPFDGRILNEGRASIVVDSWEIYSYEPEAAESQLAVFQGCTSPVPLLAGQLPLEAELSFPAILVPGDVLEFRIQLRIETDESEIPEPLLESLIASVGGTIPVEDLVQQPLLATDLLGNSTDPTAGVSADSFHWLKICFRVHTSSGTVHGYSFLWAPPGRISDAHRIGAGECS